MAASYTIVTIIVASILQNNIIMPSNIKLLKLMLRHVNKIMFWFENHPLYMVPCLYTLYTILL